MKAILIMDENYGIGYKNKPILRFQEDIDFFQQKIRNQKVVVGFKTFMSLPTTVLHLPYIIFLIVKEIIPSDELMKLLEEKGYFNIDNKRIKCPLIYQFVSEECKTSIPSFMNDAICIGGSKTYDLFADYIDTYWITYARRVVPDVDTFLTKRIVDKITNHENVNYIHSLYTNNNEDFTIYELGIKLN